MTQPQVKKTSSKAKKKKAPFHVESVKLPGFFRALAWLAANVNCLRSEFREAKEESEDDSEEEEEDEACRLQHPVITNLQSTIWMFRIP